MTSPTPPPQAAARASAGEPGLAATVALYALARLGLVAAVALVLTLAGAPLVVALLVALIVALPLSMVLFRGLRGRLDRAIAASTAKRSAEREALRAQLRGDAEPRPGDGDRVPGSAGSADGETHRDGDRPGEQQ